MTGKLKQNAKKIILGLFALLVISTGLILCANSELLVMLNLEEKKAEGDESIEIATTNADTDIQTKDIASITQINNLSDFIKFRDSVNAGNTYAGKTVYLNTDIDLSTACNETVRFMDTNWRFIN